MVLKRREHIMLTNMQTPLVSLADIRLTSNPKWVHTPEDNLVRKLFPSCEYCKPKTMKFACIMEKYRAKFDVCCGALEIKESTEDRAVINRRCRHLAYYHMALHCLLPISNGKRKMLPYCVVRGIQERFPDPGGSHGTENIVIFSRKEKSRLYMQMKSKPVRFTYDE